MAKTTVSKEEMFSKLLGSFKGKADPIKAMFEWLTEEMMDGEMLEKIGFKAFGVKDMSAAQVSRLCEELDEKVERFLNRKLKARYPYLFVDALYEKIREDSEVGNQAVIVAIGVNESGEREVLGLTN